MSALRLGVIADPHLSLDRVEDLAWHNPFRITDAHERLDAALDHPLLRDADVIAVLGDLAHYGDRRSVRYVVGTVAAGDRPAILLSGNHDVWTPGVRLEDEVKASGAGHVLSPLAWSPNAPAIKAFEAAGTGLALHEVVAETDRAEQPFDVTASRLAEPDPAAGVDVWLTHFSVLTLEEQCRTAGLLYSGHLDILAPAPPLLPPPSGPVAVLSGHLHLRGIAMEANVLQIAFAALIEAPYEVAAVDIAVDGNEASIAYECASVIEPDVERLPVLTPPTGRFNFDAEVDRWHRA